MKIPTRYSAWLLFGPILALTVGALGLTGTVIWLAASEVDQAAVRSSQRLADTAIDAMRQGLANGLRELASDHELYDRLTDDGPAIAEELGGHLFENHGISALFFVGGPTEPIVQIAGPESRRLPPDFATQAVTALGPIVEAARADPQADRIPEAAFHRIGDAIVAAAAVAIPVPPSVNATGAPPVLLVLRLFDATAMMELARRFGLPDMRIVATSGRPSDHACPVRGPDGGPVAWVDWEPTRPGLDILNRITGTIVFIVLILMALGAVVLWRAVSVHRQLLDRAQDLEAANRALVENDARVRSALQRAEHATRAKSAFLAGISHELRTPLTSIIGFSQILKLQHHPGTGKPREQEYAEIIHDSSQHLLNIVNDILDLSKIESGGYEIQETWIDVPREVATVRTLLKAEAERRGVRIEEALAEDLPALYADAKSVRQIITNLVSNALKFTESKGWARVTVRVEGNGDLVIEVSDSGTGIAAADQENIWEPFMRARNPTVTKAEGSGLGLHLVKVLAEMHGAEVGLESELGKGTRVWVAFGSERVRAIAA